MAESLSTAQRRRIYIHCRPIFSGVNAQVRKKKRIKELVDGSNASLQPLLNDIGQKQVMKILQSLLDSGIFASETRAKLEFPDLFRPSFLPGVQSQTSEDNAARLVEEALGSIASRHSEGLEIGGEKNSEPDEHGEKESDPDEHGEKDSEPDEHGERDSEPDEHGELMNSMNGENKVETSACTCLLMSSCTSF